MITIGDVLAILTGYQPTGQERRLESFVIDSRLAVKGSVFVAFQGEERDGHAFIADAVSRGAVAALVEKVPAELDYAVLDTRTGEAAAIAAAAVIALRSPLLILVENSKLALQQLGRTWRDRFNVKVIGITGSVGKTSTKELTHAVLAQRYRTYKSPGNLNSHTGLPIALLGLEADHERAVLEMGMDRLGEIALLCQLARPEIGVVTNVGPVHLEKVGSLEGIAAAKRELVEALPSHGTAILNRDEPLVMAMADHTQAHLFTYGLTPEADVWADNIQGMGLEGIRFTLHYGSDALTVHVPLLGRHSVHTALRATAVGLVEGLAWEEIVRGLQSLSSQLRLVTVDGPHGSLIIDDTYNASPESALAALNLLADLDGRRIAVMGDMLELGAAATSSHELVGRRAMAVADILLVVGQLGRIIGETALANGMAPDQVYFTDDADGAAALLADLIQANDLILVKASRGARLDRLVTKLDMRD
ncbi:MAG: UDP-N-acetylmuramoyl-tripeptide--D-alanyl-D-alanine ligase [Anaerolineae bacterium]|nr:UDP-N-acetylmuramoyl-tripeptide--D-alanyl-D-alanine ligase [Anaerolineae bacterium]